jgi:hypothetical protein
MFSSWPGRPSKSLLYGRWTWPDWKRAI